MNKNLERLETKYKGKGLIKDERSERRRGLEGSRKSMIDMQDFSDSIENG
jgi:hypothetical protein